MIFLNFGSYWSGAPLSYLRYLTFKTLRHFHPHSRIQLFTSDTFRKDIIKESAIQEYMNPELVKKDYMRELKKLNVEIVKVKTSKDYFPYQQADVFRWFYLRKYGGFYLDPDQIILKPFKSLPLEKYDFVYSKYKLNRDYPPGGIFAPIGVLGSVKNGKEASLIFDSINGYYNPACYNAMGVEMMSDMTSKIDMSKSFNAPSDYFYPIPIYTGTNGTNGVETIYDGSFKIPKESYALHWYGGCTVSYEFNLKYTEEFAKTSKDTISKFLRSRGLI